MTQPIPTPAEIRELRQSLGLTQEQLARELFVTWATVQRWESGKSVPRPIALAQLARLASTKKNSK